jgi:hypothetical protein
MTRDAFPAIGIGPLLNDERSFGFATPARRLPGGPDPADASGVFEAWRRCVVDVASKHTASSKQMFDSRS